MRRGSSSHPPEPLTEFPLANPPLCNVQGGWTLNLGRNSARPILDAPFLPIVVSERRHPSSWALPFLFITFCNHHCQIISPLHIVANYLEANGWIPGRDWIPGIRQDLCHPQKDVDGKCNSGLSYHSHPQLEDLKAAVQSFWWAHPPS